MDGSAEVIENCADCGGTHVFNECPVGPVKADVKDFAENKEAALDALIENAATPEDVVAVARTLEAAFAKPPSTVAIPVLARWLVLDTETSDLPDWNAPADDKDQPRLAAISMIFLDADIQPLGACDAYVHPDGWEVSPEAFEHNGLTTEFLEIHGIPIADVLDVYEAAITQVGVLVAFNARFDAKIMRGELRRAGRDDHFEATKQTCLMRGMGAFNKSEGRSGRWPSLETAIVQVGYQREGKAHTARSDARAAVAVLRFLHERGAVLEPAIHYAKNRPEERG